MSGSVSTSSSAPGRRRAAAWPPAGRRGSRPGDGDDVADAGARTVRWEAGGLDQERAGRRDVRPVEGCGEDRRGYVVLAHLRAGSIRVRAGQSVVAGDHVASCGNSGNSTQPHPHIQVMETADPYRARGLPMCFRDYRVWRRTGEPPVVVDRGIPGESEVVEPS